MCAVKTWSSRGLTMVTAEGHRASSCLTFSGPKVVTSARIYIVNWLCRYEILYFIDLKENQAMRPLFDDTELENLGVQTKAPAILLLFETTYL